MIKKLKSNQDKNLSKESIRYDLEFLKAFVYCLDELCINQENLKKLVREFKIKLNDVERRLKEIEENGK